MDALIAKRADGSAEWLRTDSSGNLSTTLGTRLAGEEVDADVLLTAHGYSVTRIQNTTSAVVVKPSRGVVGRIWIAAGTSGATLAISDATTTLITIPATAAAAAPFELGILCTSSIRVQPSSTAVDVYVFWR